MTIVSLFFFFNLNILHVQLSNFVVDCTITCFLIFFLIWTANRQRSVRKMEKKTYPLAKWETGNVKFCFISWKYATVNIKRFFVISVTFIIFSRYHFTQKNFNLNPIQSISIKTLYSNMEQMTFSSVLFSYNMLEC